jgi:hypothetical protein
LIDQVDPAPVQADPVDPTHPSSPEQALLALVREVSSAQVAHPVRVDQAVVLVRVVPVVRVAVPPVVAVVVETPPARSVRAAASPRLASRSGRSVKSLKCGKPHRSVASRFHAAMARR